jgi:predicted acyltransferase (DUF342 family)
MSNQVVPLGYANTFGDWVVTTNKVLAETNDIGANNYIKDSGTFTINSSGTGLLVKNDAIVQGAFSVAGTGSSASVQNDLTVQRQLYLSNTGTSFLANGTANILGNLLVGGMIMPTYGSGSNGISFLGGTTGDSANIKYYATAGDARKLHIQVTNDTSDDIYLDASGTVVIPNSRDSTSIGTGALVVTGGMGIGGDIYIGGTMKVQSTAEIQLGGKVNISNSMLVSANVDIGQRLTVSGNTTLGANLVVYGSTYFGNTAQSTTADTGAVVVAGGVGVAKNITVDGIIQANSGSSYGVAFKSNPGGGSGDTATIKYFVVTGEQTVLELAVNNDAEDAINLSSSGPVNVTSATDASAVTNGALRVAGGASVTKKLYVGGVVNALDTTEATSASAGAVIVSGGVGVAKNIYAHGNIFTDGFLNTGANTTIFSVTDASSISSGALVIGGGVGIGKKLYVGSEALITGDITAATLTANKAVFTDANKKLTSSGTVPTNQGGTGLSSFTNSGVVYASSTSALATGSGLTYNGTDLTCGGNVTAYSDARLKKNIKIIENALEKVQELNGYTFERTDVEMSRQTGVIAQEVMHVLPEAVSFTEDGKYTVAYGNMVGLLIESIKDLNSQVTSLKEEIEKLKNPS